MCTYFTLGVCLKNRPQRRTAVGCLTKSRRIYERINYYTVCVIYMRIICLYHVFRIFEYFERYMEYGIGPIIYNDWGSNFNAYAYVFFFFFGMSYTMLSKLHKYFEYSMLYKIFLRFLRF